MRQHRKKCEFFLHRNEADLLARTESGIYHTKKRSRRGKETSVISSRRPATRLRLADLQRFSVLFLPQIQSALSVQK
jgi:hypothetical protein